MISFFVVTSFSPLFDRKRRCGDTFGRHLCRRDEKWFAVLFFSFFFFFFSLSLVFVHSSLFLFDSFLEEAVSICFSSLVDGHKPNSIFHLFRGFVSFSIGQKDAKPRNGRTNDVLVCVGPTYDCCLLLFYLFASVCFRCCSFGFVHFGKLFFLFFVIRVTCFASCSVDKKRRERKTIPDNLNYSFPLAIVEVI